MIELSNVTKRYGKHAAIDGLTLTMPDKRIYCLLGRNGAGKTTLMKLISGKISASEGEVAVCWSRVNTLNMPESVRYIEAAKTQFNMRVIDLVRLAADVDDRFDMSFAMRMVEKFHLDTRKRYRSLSFGMKTMVTTILSLASNAEIILLDEPVLGFDAIMRREFYDLLSESYAEHPRTIIVSTHLIDEIAEIAEQIVMIDRGRLVMNEDINTILERAYRVSGPREAVEAATKDKNVIATEEVGKYTIAYVYDKRIENGERTEISDLSLQELFVKMAGGQRNE